MFPIILHQLLFHVNSMFLTFVHQEDVQNRVERRRKSLNRREAEAARDNYAKDKILVCAYFFFILVSPAEAQVFPTLLCLLSFLTLQSELRPRLERLVRGRAPSEVLRLLMPSIRVPEFASEDQLRSTFKRALAKLHPDRTQYDQNISASACPMVEIIFSLAFVLICRHLEKFEERVEAEELYKIISAQYELLK